jgi:hypothetical protein
MNEFEKLKRLFIKGDEQSEVITDVPKMSTTKFILVAIIFFTFILSGIYLLPKTIVLEFTLVKISTVILVLVFILLKLFGKNNNLGKGKILTIIGWYIHGVMYISSTILILNFITAKTITKSEIIKVSNWDYSHGRSGEVSDAEIDFNGIKDKLTFDGKLHEQLLKVDSLKLTGSTGIMGLYVIKDYKVHLN